ncbi:MAG: tetratricopeptide repeat protein [candidate division KSB1 bacterium]|nr:tetratricopeptide repeat protein [candidate division KSB1 bacterium]
MQAQQWLKQGEFRFALQSTDSAEDYAPQLAEVYFMRGQILTELGDLQRAAAAYRKALFLNPAYRGGWFQFGHNAFQRKRYREALSHYRNELALAEDEQNRRKQPMDQKRRATTLLQIGRAYAKLGVLDSAAIAFHQILAVDSSFAEVYFDLSHFYHDRGEVQSALLWALKAQQLEPQNPDYRYFAGVLLLRRGRAAEALPHLETALKLRPWYYGAHYNLGQALIRLGRREEARHYLAMVDSMQALHYAIDHARASVELFPSVPRCWIDLAHLLHRAGRYDEAVHAYRVVLALEPQNRAAKNNLTTLQKLLSLQQ